jgi:hypothetical protein
MMLCIILTFGVPVLTAVLTPLEQPRLAGVVWACHDVTGAPGQPRGLNIAFSTSGGGRQTVTGQLAWICGARPAR